MKKYKNIIIYAFFIVCIGLLYFAGTVFFADKDKDYTIKEAEENDKDSKDKNDINTEMLHSEEFGMDYPAEPVEPGVQIAVSEQLKIPEDSYLKSLSVYNFHERFQPKSGSKQETWANHLSEMLLNTFFSERQWNRTIISDSYQDNYIYRLKGKKQNAFQYTASKDGGDNSQLSCEEGMIQVPVPENEDWDQAFRQYSLSLLEHFETGLWDGKESHMAVSKTENVSDSSGSYRYLMEFDGIMATEYLSIDFMDWNPWVSFRYKNGSLVSMFQMAQILLDGKRELKPAYKSMEESFGVLQESLEIYLSRRAQNFHKYYCAYIDELKLEYLIYYSQVTKKEPEIVPILTAKLKINNYDIENGVWERDDDQAYVLQLETGETDMGELYDDYYSWQTFMVDEIKRSNS